VHSTQTKQVGVFPCRGWVAPCQRAPSSIKGVPLRSQTRQSWSGRSRKVMSSSPSDLLNGADRVGSPFGVSDQLLRAPTRQSVFRIAGRVWTVLNGADARLVGEVGGRLLLDYSHIARPAMWRNLRRLSGVTIDLDYWPMKTVTRVISALALSFVVGVILASANGQDTLTALRSSLSFASITAALVALLSFGME
jgi:hypothetical protein